MGGGSERCSKAKLAKGSLIMSTYPLVCGSFLLNIDGNKLV